MSDKQQTGKCLCGDVKVTITKEHKEAATCHCEMCRRWCSGPMMAIHVGKDVVFEGEDNIATYRSSEWAERAFCKTCGTSLYYRLIDADDIILAVGLLDRQQDLALTSQIFIDEKPDFYDFANETETLTGAQVFARYAPPQE